MNANEEPQTVLNPSKVTIRQGLYLVATGGLTAVSVILLLALTANSIASASAGVTRESGVMPGSLPYVQIAVTTLLLLSPVLISSLTPFRKHYGARLPSRPALPRFLAAAALTWVAMGATGVANVWVRHWIGHDSWTGVSATREISDSEMLFLAVNAGLGEEAAYLALPFGATYLVAHGLNHALSHFGRPVIPARHLLVAASVVTMVFSATHRFTGHLYQGEVSALSGIVWGLALALVFIWVRSIWPLMVGHFIYDIPTNYETWPALISHHVIAPAVISVLALVWVRYSTTRSQATPT